MARDLRKASLMGAEHRPPSPPLTVAIASRDRVYRESLALPLRRFGILVHELGLDASCGRAELADVDVLVIGVGTGGTLTGCGRVLKARKPSLKVIAVEPAGSPVLSGGNRGPHKIQGIGAGFVPGVLDTSLIDEIITVSNDQAFEVSRLLSKTEGIPGGISTGANLAAAISVATRENMNGKTVVTFAPSCAERYYTSELFLEPGAAKA